MQVVIVLMLVMSGGDPLLERGEMTGAEREGLYQSLVDMGADMLMQESATVRDHAMREDVSLKDRIEVFQSFFEQYPFTAYHRSNLERHLLYGTAPQERMARFAGAFTATALRVFWEQPPESHTLPSAHVLPFLEGVYNHSGDTIRGAIEEGIEDVLGASSLNVREYLVSGNNAPLEIQVEAMQHCVTLGAFARKHSVTNWLSLPESMGMLADDAGVWLFDGGVLDDAHVRSLKSIFNSIPASLHATAALFTPESTPFSASAVPLRLPGVAIDIPVISMDVLRDMTVGPPYLNIPPVPEFTLVILEQLMYSIQATAASTRRDWIQRRDGFVRTVAPIPGSPLEFLAPLPVLRNSPEAFMVYIGVLWLVRGDVLIESALYPINQNLREPFYAVLLLADLFSEQRDTTQVYRTTPAGLLSGRATAIRRRFVSPTVGYVNGVAAGGQLWQYDMDDLAVLP